MSEGRVVRLDVPVYLDGQHTVGVTLTETPQGDYVIACRPKGKRIVYTGLLSDVVQIVASRHAKALAAAAGIPVPRPRKGTSRL
jgi:hypothetical protein